MQYVTKLRLSQTGFLIMTVSHVILSVKTVIDWPPQSSDPSPLGCGGTGIIMESDKSGFKLLLLF